MSAVASTFDDRPDDEAGDALARVLLELRADPRAHDFFALLRRVESICGDQPRWGRAARPSQEPLRFSQDAELDFAPAAVSSLDAEARPVPRLGVRFFGLFGSQGPMPLHFTEYVRERLRVHGDPTLARFVDVFHHRLLTFFYRAWAEAQPVVHLDRSADERYSAWLGAAFGQAGVARQAPRPAAAAELFQAGLLGARSRHPEGLQKVLVTFFGVAVAIEQHVAQWLPLEVAEQSVLGFAHNRRERLLRRPATLGLDAVGGFKVHDRQYKFRIVLGPLTLQRYEAFIPGGTAWTSLRDWVDQYAGLDLRWDVQLVLAERELPAPRLGAGVRLGLTTWLGGRHPSRDRGDLRLRPLTSCLVPDAPPMLEISPKSLFSKLDALAYQAIDGATTFARLRGNSRVELQHWLMQILNLPDSDLHRIVRHAGIDPSLLAGDLTAALDRLPRGATAVTGYSDWIDDAVEKGWLYASLMFGDTRVRTGHLVVGMLKTRSLRVALLSISKQFDRIELEELTDRFADVLAGSPEEQTAAPASSTDATGDGAPVAPAALGKQEALKRYAVDLTERARQGEIDPIAGRDAEIRQIVDILMRRRQNNPILTGEAGVGKTAVVEGFALRLARGDVPPQLKDVSVHALDIGLLQAGASMKGEFESRLRSVIDEVQASAKPIILFIDEAHTLIGAGGAAGTGDAANLLKPALARGKLRTIAATTWAEYKKHIEKDPALTRRFQVVQVDEPSEAKAILMLRGVASILETFHRVALLDEAIEAAVTLSHRYIPARQLPDKAVSLLDTACARVAVSQHATPAELEDCERRLQALEVERDIIGREASIGIDTSEREARTRAAIADEEGRHDALVERHAKEKEVVDRILALRAELREAAAPAASSATDATPAAPQASPIPGELGGPVVTPLSSEASVPSDRVLSAPPAHAAALSTASAAVADAAADTAADDGPKPDPAAGPDAAAALRAARLAELATLHDRLAALQGDAPLILPTVDAHAVASVVQDWTGVPVGRMVKNEVEAVLKLADTLNGRVIGQKHALDIIARRIQTSRARLDNPGKPIGVFMLCGTSGVGKTETALALAEALYGGEQNVITINMSEFQEAHTVSTLKGAPPGYVGYGEGGVLTEAVRRRPYSIVLLDEVEKAHPDVHEIFFQVFDKGWMEDGEGRGIDFKNTIILLTSNAGSDLIMNLCSDPDLMPDADSLAKALRAPLLKVFPAALLGRLVVVPYFPLSREMMESIVRLQLGRIGRRIADNHGIPFTYDAAVVDLVVSRCSEAESGGRVIDAILTNTVLPRISREYLERLQDGDALRGVALTVDDGEFAYAFA